MGRAAIVAMAVIGTLPLISNPSALDATTIRRALAPGGRAGARVGPRALHPTCSKPCARGGSPAPRRLGLHDARPAGARVTQANSLPAA
jgi:hypothetical protein